ncbi:helix-turn-helix domain-containing protein [Embleya sp. NPDC020630]|uniref:helix-turn-helix domain-containing protein n=1 Tax=Embleya sp. NPDC020630 TaxID=3363979 RepID=UPI0037945AF2
MNMDDHTVSFGAALRHHRRQQGLSLRQLAGLVAYSPGWLSKIENGMSTPTMQLARLCDRELAADGVLAALAGSTADDLPPRLRPAQLPPSIAGFVGRERELRDLDALLAHSTETGLPLTVAIDGPAGVGKSALMIRWAGQVSGSFPGGVLYRDLRGSSPDAEPVRPTEVLADFLIALRVCPPAVPADLEQRAAMFRSLLAGLRMLVILDNAADSRQVTPLLPGTAGCAAVVTSRRRLTGIAVRAGASKIPLGPMSPAESVALLCAVVGPDRVLAEADAARTLARHCAHLPLALRIAAERLATRPHRSLALLAEELDDEKSRLDLLADADDPHLALRSAFFGSYRDLDPEAARAFRRLGLHPDGRLETSVAAGLIGRPLGHTRRLLESLVSVHLLEETGPDRYRLATLLRAYAAERAGDEETRVGADDPGPTAR